ncbi:hypothetical protein [Desnuesiella massiliensis]|uniref:hypothetical protein n=1 Tax=Desnuesiella massiliensis TaxID=1650662 RepID=UPI0006E293AC|nr:hypothetical protein [Desnuesiella massiliensis]
MSMKLSSTFNPQDFINLKNRVKNEMNRRNGNGSLTQYASASYDFSKSPKKGNTISIEHYSKIRDVMAAINPAKVALPSKKFSQSVPYMVLLEANMTTFEAQPRGERSNNDCASACSGMCINTCTTSCTGGCNGCSGCGGVCSTSCTGGCDGCSGCGGACSTSCTGNCDGCTGCRDACTGCTGGCTGTCSGCTGCGGYCANSCLNGCCGYNNAD